uniref:Uncharacterized protein n=1 Tax=Chromera velia CCMP2878 TaxID=1169474 RepID=A0A0K6SB05_9ALVE|eukprot:Cvel_12025.t2-p1 / transcript=Cvel_12025.t2 / gene=Cvel_12025 / organism=Chromera_velia_CCMP2878 / gene_product=Putative ankyrin repeat protein MM_0045, putative / transcript_product=Putative ankyrin repeat protein MM_0045, putative / location=Cvel_scaffold772:18773-21160(+) / protein_length=796 / sequence_SO=supercontig / SO=protein_coding / is_pseudo=false
MQPHYLMLHPSSLTFSPESFPPVVLSPALIRSGTTGVSPHPVVLQAETGSGGGLGRALGNGFKFIDLIQSTETDEEEEEPKSTEEDGGRTKLMVASESGDAEKVKMLLADQDVCVDGQDIKGRTALSLAAEEGHAAVVRLLVEARANVDLQDKKGWTPFNRACMENRTDVVQLLLDAKANPNIKSNNGWTPLLELSQHGHTDLVRQVIEELNTNVNIQGTAGGTALMVASSKRHGAIVRLLLDANSDTSLQYNGDTALINASSRGHADIVCLLLDAQKGKGETDPKERGKALMKACGNGRAKVVQMPIHQSPEFCFSEVDRDNSTVLMLAVKKGDVEIVELLLSFSAAKIALDTPDAKGFTPLMQAAARGHTRLADLLIGRGADLELEDGHGRTALIVAEEAGNLQVAERLRSAGKGKGKREDSWSVEMKAEWAELRSLIDIGAVAFWPLHFLKSLLRNDNRLPYRQKIAKTAETLGTVCDPFSAQTMAPEPPHPVGAPFKLVAVSYPWLSREHPDPEGFRLRSVVEQLDQYWWAQEGSLVSAYVFWDFLSLYQHPPGSKRTSEQDALFKAGLSKMDVIYSSPHTHVIRSTDVPSANPTPYSDRGWCYFEAAVTTFKPPGQVASDEKEKAHRQNKGVQTEENAIRIPATPEVFDAEIDTKKFTNGKSDADPVKALYRSFLQRSAHKLRVFADGSWASSEKERRQMDASTALRLAEIVEFVSADTSLSTRLQPQVLDLQGSVFDGAVREWKISLSAEEQKEALELGQALERLLSSFGKLGSVRSVKQTVGIPICLIC